MFAVVIKDTNGRKRTLFQSAGEQQARLQAELIAPYLESKAVFVVQRRPDGSDIVAVFEPSAGVR